VSGIVQEIQTQIRVLILKILHNVNAILVSLGTLPSHFVLGTVPPPKIL
jgi:hypothetical protein